MRVVFIFVLFIGVAIAGGAVYLAMERFNAYESALANERKNQNDYVELTTVYVTKEELRYGQKLTKENVQAVKWPVAGVPETAFTNVEQLLGLAEEEDQRMIVRTMDAGEVILSTKVTELGEDAGVASRLKAGMRAFTISVDVASGVSGFLRPGDKIDVYWSGEVGRERMTKLILDGIELIAIDQNSAVDLDRPTVARTVTVAVSPRTVASLAQAQSTGQLLLSLRGVNDDTSSEAIQMTQNDLLGVQEVAAVAEKEVCTVKTRKGSDLVETQIPCSN